ncbi:SAV_2336 N-terminal domain-related protein [Streptomyces sp. NPDC020298]|uniref:SAV_2336 N-terminal domain-related protein n=1 Tax=unclassified Streptomyces TaxID=2593676 RepID=UPI0033CEEB89
MPEQLGRVLGALIDCLDGEVDALALADALWLAAASPAPGDTVTPADRPTAAAEAGAGESGDPPRAERRPRQSTVPPRPVGVPATPRPDCYPLYEEFGDSSASLSGPSVSVAAGRSLSQTVELGRSLRPFMRRYPRGRKTGLDMQATIDSYARGGELVPVLAPLPEPWFDVVVVVDTHLTTEVWRGAIEEFVALLENAGAFRSVRRWHLSTDGHDPYVTDARGHFVHVTGAVGTENRRLFLVLSDCTAPAWYEAKVWQLLRQWAMRAPLSVANPLPSRLWHRTALDLPAVHVRNRVPGSNSTLRVTPPPHLKGIVKQSELYLAIPTLSLTAHSLQRWARGFVRGAPEGYDAVLVGPSGNAPSPFLAYSRPPTEEERAESAGNAAHAFLHMASPAAVRLAALCCSFGRLSLPLLQLIRQEVVRDADNADVAELLTSSLLHIDTDRAGPPLITFTDQAREQLTAVVSRHDAWWTYEALSRYIAERTRLPAQSLDAVAALPADRLPEDLQPFAHASQELLKALRKGSAGLRASQGGSGTADLYAQRAHEDPVPGRSTASDARFQDDPQVEQELGRLRSELWDGIPSDRFTDRYRQAADQVLKAFVYFLAQYLAGQADWVPFAELDTLTAELARSASLHGVHVDVGADPSFTLRARVPGIDDSVVVLGEVFALTSPILRSQWPSATARRDGPELRIAPFTILITLIADGRTGPELLSGKSVSVTGGPGSRVVVLRFPL